MTPLQIDILLRMYALSDPWSEPSLAGRTSQAMDKAFAFFHHYQLIHPELDNQSLGSFNKVVRAKENYLTHKGKDLIKKLTSVMPDDVPTRPNLIGEFKVPGNGEWFLFHHPITKKYGVFDGKTRPGPCNYDSIREALDVVLPPPV